MKFYSSFLIRSWLISDSNSGEGTEEKLVFDVEHIQKGEHFRASGPAEAIEWIIASLKLQEKQRDLEDEETV